jgi:SAM-dependent methyltransferase
MADRGLSFGAAAAAYERYRPGYPGQLFDVVTNYAGRPIRTALEIGAGTGKATRLFAARGVIVTAIEPDAAMLVELTRHVPPTVNPLQVGFEDLDTAETYELVYAAASLHWTEPQGRWSRVAKVLEPGGIFAAFGGPVELVDPGVRETVRAARAPLLENDDVAGVEQAESGPEMRWPSPELQRSEWFTDVQQTTIGRRFRMTARDYIGHLSTISAYLQLPASQRARVLARIMLVLPERVEVAADVVVQLARRRAD